MTIDKNIHLCPLKKKLLSRLGPNYEARIIDGEPCVYRDLGDYDIEISGGSSRHPFYVYVWRKTPQMEIVEQHKNTYRSFLEMEALLNNIVLRYKCRNANSDNNMTNNE